MTNFYLITGFLGAGKTSLLKSLLPLFTDRKIRLIINEFGKVGLDGALMRAAGADAEYVGTVRHRESEWLDSSVGEIRQLRRQDWTLTVF